MPIQRSGRQLLQLLFGDRLDEKRLLNPDAGSLYFLLLGRAYYFLGDSEQSRVNLEHALLRNSENLEAPIYLVAVHKLAGASDAAEWQVSEIRTLEPAFNVRNWLASYPMTDTAQKERLVKALQEVVR